MKIVDVKGYTVETPVRHQFVWRKGLPGSGASSETTWLHLITDEGIEGFSPIARGAIALDLIRRDARLCQDLRKRVGDEIALMYDGSPPQRRCHASQATAKKTTISRTRGRRNTTNGSSTPATIPMPTPSTLRMPGRAIRATSE